MALFPVVRSSREQAIVATAGQTVFGPLNFRLDDSVDLAVQAKLIGGVYLPVMTGFTVAIDAVSKFPTITFAAGRAVGESLLFQAQRIDARESDVTLGGAIRSSPLEQELSRFTRVNQELRRDIDRALTQIVDGDPYDAGGARIAGLADPLGAQDAATKGSAKAYADSVIGDALLGQMPDNSIPRIKLDETIQGAVPITPDEFGAVGDGVADDTAAVLAASAAAGPDGRVVLSRDGAIYRMTAPTTITAEVLRQGANLLYDAGVGAGLRNEVIDVRDYLNSYTSTAFAVEQALARLRDSTNLVLQGTGSHVGLDRPLLFNEGNNLQAFNGLGAQVKIIKDLWLRPAAAFEAAFPPGAVVARIERSQEYTIPGDDTTPKLPGIHHWMLQNCRFGAQNLPNVIPFQTTGYFHFYIVESVFEDYRELGFKAAKGSHIEAAVGGHGLYLSRCYLRSSTTNLLGVNASDIATAVLIENPDNVWEGGHVQGAYIGGDMHAGHTRVRGVHFSLGGGQNEPMKYGLICRHPQTVSVIDNDFDKGIVLFTNAGLNPLIEPSDTYRNILITMNTWASGNPSNPLHSGLLHIETALPNTSIKGFQLVLNPTFGNDEDIPVVDLSTTGPGAWKTAVTGLDLDINGIIIAATAGASYIPKEIESWPTSPKPPLPFAIMNSNGFVPKSYSYAALQRSETRTKENLIEDGLDLLTDLRTGEIVICSDAGGGTPVPVVWRGNRWKRLLDTMEGMSPPDADLTLTELTHASTIRLTTVLTAIRTITLEGTDEASFMLINAAASGSIPWNVGGVKMLYPGQWCRVGKPTADWRLLAFGTLADEVKATVVYDPPNLAAGAGATTPDVPLAGAVFGDQVSAAYGGDLQGITLTGAVSSAGNARATFLNGTAGAIDLPSGTVTLRRRT